jgi:pilus assembly protein Flp/PilA
MRGGFVKTLLKRFLLDEAGSTAIEYALIGSIVSVAILAALITMGNVLDADFAGIGTEFR